MRLSTLVRVTLLALLAIFAGCGKSSRFPVAPVIGQVTLDGEPVKSGIVTFVPDPEHGTQGPIGVGEIHSDGTYRIVTDPYDDRLAGALVGFHKIRVTQRDGEYRQKIWHATDVVPVIFASEATSGLTAEVLPGVTNTVDLELTRPAAEP